MSWIHERDFVRAVEFVVERKDFAGPVNLASPAPLPQAQFMRTLRDVAGVSIGLPATKWMVAIGAVFMQTDTELVLKSRRVVPKRLVDAGFTFEFPEWTGAAKELVGRWRER
jgi:NAD dependent epimerase/dehydratase family enzyme